MRRIDPALGVGAIQGIEGLQADWALERRFTPERDDLWRTRQRDRWEAAVRKA